MGYTTQSAKKAPIKLPKPLTLHGSVLDNQSRNIMAMCDFAGVSIDTKLVDFRAGVQGMKEKGINEIGCMPVIEKGHDKVFGGNNIIYLYLCKEDKKLGSMMLPSAVKEDDIKGMLGWY